MALCRYIIYIVVFIFTWGGVINFHIYIFTYQLSSRSSVMCVLTCIYFLVLPGLLTYLNTISCLTPSLGLPIISFQSTYLSYCLTISEWYLGCVWRHWFRVLLLRLGFQNSAMTARYCQKSKRGAFFSLLYLPAHKSTLSSSCFTMNRYNFL